jgi:hypothetical protein
MSTIAINYVFNPFAGFFKKLVVAFEIIGYSRAASELARLGYHKEAKTCMMQIKALKADTNENLKGWV